MGFFEVTSGELRRRAETLTELNEQFRNKKTDLESRESGLASMWEGEAKNVFHQAFLRDMTQMDAFYQLIIQYVQALLAIAARYEETERRNAELAAARAY
ncbi:MAG: WXG100 family type VII secretion target [Lachnospiraceae bacterium]|nr:WXG100 family type VII secretion target [Lachnospiraceae bacterium]